MNRRSGSLQRQIYVTESLVLQREVEGTNHGAGEILQAKQSVCPVQKTALIKR